MAVLLSTDETLVINQNNILILDASETYDLDQDSPNTQGSGSLSGAIFEWHCQQEAVRTFITLSI